MVAPVWQSATNITSTNGTSAVFTLPASLAVGDILVVSLYKENTAAVTLPDGTWAQENAVATTTNIQQQLVFWKRCVGGETGTVTFSWTGSVFRSGSIHRISGCVSSGDPWWPTQSTNFNNTAASTTPAVSLTGTPTDSLLIFTATDFAGTTTTWSLPTGFTQRFATSTIVLMTKDNTAGGNTGTLQSTVDTGTDTMTAFVGTLLSSTGAATDGGRLFPSASPFSRSPFGLGRPALRTPTFSSGPPTTQTPNPFIGWGWGVNV